MEDSQVVVDMFARLALIVGVLAVAIAQLSIRRDEKSGGARSPFDGALVAVGCALVASTSCQIVAPVTSGEFDLSASTCVFWGILIPYWLYQVIRSSPP